MADAQSVGHDAAGVGAVTLVACGCPSLLGAAVATAIVTSIASMLGPHRSRTSGSVGAWSVRRLDRDRGRRGRCCVRSSSARVQCSHGGVSRRSRPGAPLDRTRPPSPPALPCSTIDRAAVPQPVASAIVGVAVAVAASLWRPSGASSLTGDQHAAAIGASWDVLVGVGNSSKISEIATRVAAARGLDAAAMIPGAPVALEGRELWVQAFAPIEGVPLIEPVITSGRAPVGSDEIALGSVAMRRAGARVGDEVSIESGVAGVEPQSLRVVGTTMVTDGLEPNVGLGGIVSLAGLERIAPEATGPAVVRVGDGPGREAALDGLRAAFPESYKDVALPSSLRNAERVAGLPVPVAVGAALVSIVTLATRC